MIVCEGLHFRREGEDWRCVEHAAVRMMRGGGYKLDGNDRLLLTLEEALEELLQKPKRERRRAPRCS